MKMRSRIRIGVACMAASMVLALGLGGTAFAAGVADQAQAEIQGTGQAELTVGQGGHAVAKIAIEKLGHYSIASVSSTGVDGNTMGTLYDASGNELCANDDRNADTNFGLSRELVAGVYYVDVCGKEEQEGASITVSVTAGQALNEFDRRFVANENNEVTGFELGAWEQGESNQWVPLDANAYQVVGYTVREVFAHAQESGAVDSLRWADGLPSTEGRFVVKVAPTEGSAYVGAAFYTVEVFDPEAEERPLSELDPQITYAICGSPSKVELGAYTIVPTNWSARWDAISSSYYKTVGFCSRADFEAWGGDNASATWAKGLPSSEGSFVVKLTATSASGNPFFGSTYVWVSLSDLSHAGSGSWVVDKNPTYSTKGSRHLNCEYCGSVCDVTSIPALKGSVVSAGSSGSFADYKVTSSSTVTYVACLVTKKTAATVPATVSIWGKKYKVTAIASKAFAQTKKVKTVTVQTKLLKKSTVKKSLSGSKVATVKVPSSKKKAYKAIFAKKNAGKAVKVK